MKRGTAEWNATTQHFLEACPAVISWTPTPGDDSTITFIFDPSIEVHNVPPGVEFSPCD